MTSERRTTNAKEFGDFQTPPALAEAVCRLLAAGEMLPASILEPTCGVGNFLVAGAQAFPAANTLLAADINAAYLREAEAKLQITAAAGTARLLLGSFFDLPWPNLLRELPDPLLVLGNPPWVTNSELGALASDNLPKKSNLAGHSGLDAMTGKSNFDISEWILTRLLEWLDGRRATLAMLCKTAVARRVLAQAWLKEARIEGAEIRPIDAAQHFGAAVSACLLICRLAPGGESRHCEIKTGWSQTAGAASSFGWRDGQLVAELSSYERTKHLQGHSSHRWRSGIKHDCARVMELSREGDGYRNGLDEVVELDEQCLFPLLKSSDLANGRAAQPRRHLLVTQRSVSDDTAQLSAAAPKVWAYLQSHAELLDRRGSSIYRNRARFAIFGVGDYTFAPWKVAISGLYKRLRFAVVGNYEGKPIVLDDTACFLPCRSEAEAEYVADLLNSPEARDFFTAFLFWDAKRPITVDILKRLSLPRLARQLGSERELEVFLANRASGIAAGDDGLLQLGLFPSGR